MTKTKKGPTVFFPPQADAAIEQPVKKVKSTKTGGDPGYSVSETTSVLALLGITSSVEATGRNRSVHPQKSLKHQNVHQAPATFRSGQGSTRQGAQVLKGGAAAAVSFKKRLFSTAKGSISGGAVKGVKGRRRSEDCIDPQWRDERTAAWNRAFEEC